MAYDIRSCLIAGRDISWDDAFEIRVTTDLKVSFGGVSTTAQRKVVELPPLINMSKSQIMFSIYAKRTKIELNQVYLMYPPPFRGLAGSLPRQKVIAKIEN